MGASAGLSGEEFVHLLADADAGIMRPLTHRYAERILHHDFEGGMPLEAALKDSRLALQLAQDGHVPLFAIQAAHTVYELGLGADLGRDDYAAVAELWERWTGYRLSSESAPGGAA